MSAKASKGLTSERTSSHETVMGDAQSLLKTLLAKREAGFRGRGKYHPPTAPDVNGLPNPPIGWVWASPEQLSNAAPYALGIGPFGSNLKVSDYRETGTPLIFVRNIRAEDFSLVAKFVAEEKANELAAHTAQGGDILITKMGEPPGDVALYPVGAPTAVITADCIKWRLAEDLRVPKFFVYAMRSALVQQQIQSRTRGVAQKKISLERFRDLAIPLPPLPEQRRIVAEIEQQFTRLDAGVAALRRTQANLKRYRAAVLKAACEGRLVPTEAELAREHARVLGSIPTGDFDSPSQSKRPKAHGSTPLGSTNFETGEALLARILTERRKQWVGRGRYKEPTIPQPIIGVTLPEGWTWATMPQLGELNRGKSKHRPRDDTRLYDGPYPFIQTGDIRRSGGTIREHTQTYSDFGLQQSRLWPAGTLCITIAANIAETGILAFPSCFPDSVVGFCHDGPRETTRYIEFFFRTAKDELERFAPATAQKNINLEVLQNVVIPLPPLVEQTRIVAEVERRLSVADELESVVKTNLQRATRLRQSVLQQAFAPKLT